VAESDWVDDQNSDADWVDDPQREQEGISPILSGVRNFVQGASGGLSDEIAGGIEAAGQAIGLRGAGGPIKDISLSDEGPTLDWSILRDAYKRARDREREDLKKDSEINPATSMAANIGGAVASPLNKLVSGMGAVKAGATLGGITGAGMSNADDATDLLKDTLVGTAGGAALGGAAEKVGGLVSSGTKSAGKKLSSFAEKMAENATGATGKQASEFADDAGRQLLDRGLVKFGDNAEKVAGRVQGAMDAANSQIDDALRSLDDSGGSASVENIVDRLQERANLLRKDPSQAAVANKIDSVIEDIISTGNPSVSLSEAEGTKRGFNKMARNWMDPEAGKAGKEAYLAYRDEVERAANALDPGVANLFKEGKKTHGLLSPILDASEKRALQQSQSPVGGLFDFVSAGSGGAVGGVPGAIAGFAAKRIVAPRLASSTAVTADKISQSLLRSPQMLDVYQKNPQLFQSLVSKLEHGMTESGFPRAAEASDQAKNFDEQLGKDALLQKTANTKYAQVLQQAAQKGEQSLAAAHYVLQNRDEEYRKAISGGM